MRFSSLLLLSAAAVGAYAQDPTVVAPGGSDTLAPAPSDTVAPVPSGTTVVGGGATDTALPPDASGPAAPTDVGGEAPLPPVDSGLPSTPVDSGIPLPPAGSLDTTPAGSTATELPGDGDGAAFALGANPVTLSLLVAGVVGAML